MADKTTDSTAGKRWKVENIRGKELTPRGCRAKSLEDDLSFQDEMREDLVIWKERFEEAIEYLGYMYAWFDAIEALQP